MLPLLYQASCYRRPQSLAVDDSSDEVRELLMTVSAAPTQRTQDDADAFVVDDDDDEPPRKKGKR